MNLLLSNKVLFDTTLICFLVLQWIDRLLSSASLALIKRHNRLEDKLFEIPAMLKVSQHY